MEKYRRENNHCKTPATSMGEGSKIFIKFYRILSRVVKGMQTSVVVVILFVCFFSTGSVFSFLYYIFTGVYLHEFIYLFVFVLFCFCSLKPLTTADNVQIIHLHKSIQFTLTLSRNYLKQRSQKLNTSIPFPFQEQKCCGHR